MWFDWSQFHYIKSVSDEWRISPSKHQHASVAPLWKARARFHVPVTNTLQVKRIHCVRLWLAHSWKRPWNLGWGTSPALQAEAAHWAGTSVFTDDVSGCVRHTHTRAWTYNITDCIREHRTPSVIHFTPYGCTHIGPVSTQLPTCIVHEPSMDGSHYSHTLSCHMRLVTGLSLSCWMDGWMDEWRWEFAWKFGSFILADGCFSVR